jgi:hypothetical protein
MCSAGFFKKNLAGVNQELDNAEINLKKGATTVDRVFDVSKRNLLNRKISDLLKIFTKQK